MRTTSLAALAIGLGSPLYAQSIPPDRYLEHLPPMPKIVREARATAHFQLFGDRSLPEYRDRNLDGIDDERAEWLLELATRFAPVMRRNNFSAPRNFHLAAGKNLYLRRDVWRIGERVSSDSILLGSPGRPTTFTKAASTVDQLAGEPNDSTLLALLRTYSPRLADGRSVSPEPDSEVVLFVDFPGFDEPTWRRAYRGTGEVAVYVHAFIDDLSDQSEARYALVLQYWFFYPFNDGTNNHEGDWEHINVVLTLDSLRLRRDDARLTEVQLRELINSRAPGAQLAIASVEYYFHETFTVLNYLGPNGHRVQTPELQHPVWADSGYIDRVIRERVRNPALATHPIVYIGGNNRGPDEFGEFWPRFGAAYNRNSHGSYPLPGTWQSVGPLLATEKLSGVSIPVITEAGADSIVFADPNFLLFRRKDIVLVPDWERVLDLMEQDPVARSEWAWLVLPMRWGFPASASPGASLMKHTDLGQVSPEGPAYQPTWNRLGYRTGWREFRPHVLRVWLVPTSPWVYVKNGWGVLNVPLTFIALMPGWSVGLTQVLPWVTGALNLLGSPPARTYYPGEPPFRFSSIGAGPSYSFGGERYARLLPADTGSAALHRVQQSGSKKVGRLDHAAVLRLQMNMFYGRTLSVENSFTFGVGQVRWDDGNTSDGDAARATGTLAMRELTGGFRLNRWTANDDVLQFYGRAGYGYTWYSLTNVSIGGKPDDYEHKGGYATTLYPSLRWWPNTWYLGTGIELFAPKKTWLLDRVGLGFRVDVNTKWHSLDVQKPGAKHLGWVRRNEVAYTLLAAW